MRFGAQIPSRVDIWFENFALSAGPAPLAISTMTIRCQWEDETAKDKTGHPPSYAEAKKMNSLTLRTGPPSYTKAKKMKLLTLHT